LISWDCFADVDADYRFRLLNADHGLASTEITKIFQQSNGFIWIGSDRGISRYDGHDFLHYSYSPGAPRHISNNFVHSIIEDHLGNIWIGTEDGLNRIDPTGKIEIHKQDDSKTDSIPTDWITTLFEDNDGIIWVGTGYGLFSFSPDDYTVTEFTPMFEHETRKSALVQNIVKLKSGEIIVNTTIGLGVVDEKSKSIKPYLQKNSDNMVYDKFATKILRFEDDKLLVATETEGLVVYNTESGSLMNMRYISNKEGLRSNLLSDLMIDNRNNLWIAYANHGLSIHDMHSGKIRHIIKNEFEAYSLPTNSIRNLFIDKSGLIWIGTDDGVALYSHLTEGTTLYFKRPDGSGLSSDTVYQFFVDEHSRSWIASENGLMQLKDDGETIKKFPLIDNNERNYNSQEVWRIASAENGDLWLATDVGLLLFNPLTGTSINISDQANLPPRAVYTLLAGEQGSVWVTGYMDLGLIKIDAKKQIAAHLLKDDSSRYWESGDFTFAKILTSEGALMLATTDGVFRVNKDNSVIHYPLSQDKDFTRATSIVEVSSREYWVTTQGLGLVKLSISSELVASYEYFNESNGFPSNELKALILDQDQIWFNSKDKLYRYNLKSEKVEEFPNLFSIPQMTFSENGMTKSENMLYIAGSRGLLAIDTQKIRQNTFDSPIKITSVSSSSQNRLNASELVHGEKIELEYEDNDIEISFASLDYSSPLNTRYSYRLDGQNNTWSEPSNRRTVAYSNLGFGHYTFKVKGTNSGGLWNEEIAELTFVVLKPWWFYLIIALATTTLLTLVFYLINRRKQLIFLHEKAHVDTLTGVSNRFSFNQKLADTLDLNPDNFALAIIDLDGFKEVNDTFGHQVGDTLLIKAAARIRTCIRKSDFLARLGGDEFVLIMPQYKHLDDAIRITERIKDSLKNDYQIAGNDIAGSCSIGVGIYPQDGADSESLLTHTDAAMYEAKNSGKNKVFFFNESLSQALGRKLKIRSHLKTALLQNQFSLYYQPKYDQFTNQLVGAEALIRWIHPEDGFIPPEEFIPEAESNGTIIDIGEWVLYEACLQTKRWQQKYNRSCRVSINVSPVQIAQPGFVQQVANVIQQTKVDPLLVELEITESVLIESRQQIQQILQQLQKIGVTIALDDFGVGFSSLSYLTQFSIDTLKIDRSFVKDLREDTQNFLVLKNIYALARDLNMEIVAEGVEDKAQLEIIAEFGGALIQGYYFSPPVKPEELDIIFDKASKISSRL
jgi:diguanylate cyclase (GGDEF)-like protein